MLRERLFDTARSIIPERATAVGPAGLRFGLADEDHAGDNDGDVDGDEDQVADQVVSIGDQVDVAHNTMPELEPDDKPDRTQISQRGTRGPEHKCGQCNEFERKWRPPLQKGLDDDLVGWIRKRAPDHVAAVAKEKVHVHQRHQ